MRYAVGEIILVIIGILIALYINNWNETRLQNDQLHKALGTLVKELRVEKENLRNSISVNSFRVHSVQRLLQFAGVKPIKDWGALNLVDIIPYAQNVIWKGPLPDSLNMEFIRIAFTWVGKNANRPINTNTIDELKNTGMFSQMENTELKAAIANYYNGPAKDLDASREKEKRYSEKWEQSFIDDGLEVYNILSVEDPLNVLRVNKSRVEILKFIILETSWYAYLSSSAIKTIDELIPLIEAEIKK